MKCFISLLTLFSFAFALCFSSPVLVFAEDDISAAPLSVLPSGGKDLKCDFNEHRREVNTIAADESLYIKMEESKKTNLLVCGIRTGYMKFWMLKFYVVYVLNFLIGISGVLAVLMLVVGAYYYIAGGFNEDMDTGKNIIKYALLGFALVILSWSLVNGLLILITS